MASSSTPHFPHAEPIRPTLPPLRSLRLLDICARTNSNIPAMTNETHSNDLFPPMPMDMYQRGRQSSVSSSSSSAAPSSRAPSPTPPAPARRPQIVRTIKRHHPYLRPNKCRVVLSNSFDKADAMLIFPLPADAYDENNKPIAARLKKYKPSQAYLVVGKLAVELRSPKNRAMFRAAIYPYRFVPRNPQDQPPSSATPDTTPATSSAEIQPAVHTTPNVLNATLGASKPGSPATPTSPNPTAPTEMAIGA